MSSRQPLENLPDDPHRKNDPRNRQNDDYSNLSLPTVRVLTTTYDPVTLLFGIGGAQVLQKVLHDLGWSVTDDLASHLQKVASGESFKPETLWESAWYGSSCVEQYHRFYCDLESKKQSRYVILGTELEENDEIETHFNAQELRGLEDFQVRLAADEKKLLAAFEWDSKLTADEHKKRQARWGTFNRIMDMVGHRNVPFNLSEFIEDNENESLKPNVKRKARIGDFALELRRAQAKKIKDHNVEFEMPTQPLELARISALTALPLKADFFSELLSCLESAAPPPSNLLNNHMLDLKSGISFIRPIELTFHLTHWSDHKDSRLMKAFVRDNDNPYCPLTLELERFEKAGEKPDLRTFFCWDRATPTSDDLPWAELEKARVKR